jgi:hypothetical protein
VADDAEVVMLQACRKFNILFFFSIFGFVLQVIVFNFVLQWWGLW